MEYIYNSQIFRSVIDSLASQVPVMAAKNFRETRLAAKIPRIEIGGGASAGVSWLSRRFGVVPIQSRKDKARLDSTNGVLSRNDERSVVGAVSAVGDRLTDAHVCESIS